MLRAVLARKKGRLAATRIAVTVGKYFCLAFVIYGLLNMRFLLAFIGGYIYFAGQQEYRMVMMENQSSPFQGNREGRTDVEVSPPPYVEGGGGLNALTNKLRNLFRR